MVVFRLHFLWPPLWLLLLELEVCRGTTDCTSKTERYYDARVVSPSSFEKNSSACQQRCVEKPICEHFTFDQVSVPSGACWLFTGAASKVMAINVVSGPKVCPEDKTTSAKPESTTSSEAATTAKTQEETERHSSAKHDEDHASAAISHCPHDLDTKCPKHWYSGPTGGYYCSGSGSAEGACREAAHEPFPLEDCKEQCIIGHVSIAGHRPKPVMWDCQQGLHHWGAWPEEKQTWCCSHSSHARAVCGHHVESHLGHGSSHEAHSDSHEHSHSGSSHESHSDSGDAPLGGQVSKCEDGLGLPCPTSWNTGPGGYYCFSIKGCRPVVEGPFPFELCQDQCYIGDVNLPGGGHLAVPFDCYSDLDNLKLWGSLKKQWCCENSPAASIVCNQDDSDGVQECADDQGTSCPSEWHTGDTGGYYCSSGPSKGGCRQSSSGPFTVEDCHVQCSIGNSDSHGGLGGLEMWDCQRHLAHWQFWPEAKKLHCCAHDQDAKKVCSHYMGSNALPGAPIRCHHEAASKCPDDWLTGDKGGYYCMGKDDPAQGGCRPSDEGPYPGESCQEQCRIGHVTSGGLPPTPAFWDCHRNVKDWTWWPEEKKMYCCKHGDLNPSWCSNYVDREHVWGALSFCPRSLKTHCPEEWYTGDSGGYYCKGPGTAVGACRKAEDEPFPLEDCKEQCTIGHVSIGGHRPKPAIWDCVQGLYHWMAWPEEKKLWCCAHSPRARAVCGHYAASHSSISCNADTAGGIPCDFPFLWQGKQHHSCYVESNKFGGEPWCIRVDGSWASCDCGQVGGSPSDTHVSHVSHLHPGHWHHAASGLIGGGLHQDSHADSHADSHGVLPPYNCDGEETTWTNTKSQWCCKQEECNETASHPFDCLADLIYWETDWSLQKKSWCWDTAKEVSADLFDCDLGLANADRAWSADKKQWCCQEKHKGCGPLFDCDKDLAHWETAWNETKKKWCWDHEHKGYRKLYDCKAGLTDWLETWSNQKKVWCCETEHLGCGNGFDCETDFASWETAWTTPQKHFCCQTEHKACYDCEAGFANWERGWSASKKAYCCEKEKKACHSCLQVNEMDSWSQEHREYCCSNHNVACHDCSGDVHSFSVEKEAWCCQNEGRCVNATTTTLGGSPCPDAGVDEDDPEYCDSPIGTWTTQKKEFCCKNFNRGCPGQTYDCTIDAKIWQYAWSKTKKAWCCLHQHVGCYPHYDCDTAPTSWSPEKKVWCCHHQHQGCEMYDCYGPPHLWTEPRKTWCCREHGQGCSDLEPYHCQGGAGQNIYWSPEKKDWCCTHKQIGCSPPDSDLGHGLHHHHHHYYIISGGSHHGHISGNSCDRNCNWDGQTHTCRQRIEYAASHRFTNQKHACTAAVHLVAGECDFCGECTVEMSGCYVYWHAEAHHKITHHVVTTVTRLGSTYNCDDGMDGMWSQEQRDYCCWKDRKGCPAPIIPEASYDCETGFDQWETEWEAVHKEWCCKHRQRACARYQCDLGLADFQHLWGPPKKVWCCEHEHKGCIAGFQWFDCTEKAEHWETMWNPEKKGWCCAHKKMGCPGWQWHPGGATHVTHTTYTTHHHDVIGGRWVVGWHGQGHSSQVIGGGVIDDGHSEHHSTLHFDCHAALDNWEDAWSPDKKLWCWTNERLGYHKLFNCHKGEAKDWSALKEKWCCTHLHMCYHPKVPRPVLHYGGGAWGKAGEFVKPVRQFYNCNSALINWEDAWSPGKKKWCWSNERKGGAEPYECYDHKAGTWSAPKKAWCCDHKKEVCPERRLLESLPALYA